MDPTLTKDYTTSKSDTVSLADAVTKQGVLSARTDTLTLADASTRQAYKVLTDVFTLVETLELKEIAGVYVYYSELPVLIPILRELYNEWKKCI